MAVRLCRQRQPYLPLVAAERTLAASILDTMTDGITHNLRRRLDVSLYILNIQVMLRIISHLARSRTRLTYHWSELFRALLTLVRFLTSYVADVKSLAHMDELVDTLVTVVALSLSAGEAFLPSPAAYDDLFYKVVETGAVLAQFRDGYGLDRRRGHAIEILVGVSRHYDELLKAGNTGSTGRAGKALTSAQVAGVIKQGYDTLSLQAGEGLEAWTAYREADERGFLKKMARVAVVDCREVVQVCEGASG